MTPSKEPSAKRLDIVADEVRSRSSDFLLAFRAGEYVPGDRHGRRVVQPPIPVHQVGYNCGYVCPCHRQGHPDNNRQGIGTVQRQAVLW